MTWSYRGHIGCFTFQEPAVINTIINAVQTNTPLHWYPHQAVFRPLIRSSTIRMMASPLLKSRLVLNTLKGVFKSGSNASSNVLQRLQRYGLQNENRGV
jgi:hypothetical protein